MVNLEIKSDWTLKSQKPKITEWNNSLSVIIIQKIRLLGKKVLNNKIFLINPLKKV